MSAAPRYRDASGRFTKRPAEVAPTEPDTAAEARAIHIRRELHDALEWGFAFLDAFDLGPAALDVIDGAIARMDERDAPDEDLEPYLAAYYNGALDPTGEAEGVDEDGDDLDRGEHDIADDEASLGWPEDPAAVVGAETWILTAEVDAELDEADREHDERHGGDVWMFGPSRREVAHA